MSNGMGGAPRQREKMDALRTQMSVLQQQARALGLPAMIVFEGFGAAGKGDAISGLIESLDPRGFRVHTIRKANEVERRYPPMKRFFDLTPADGRIEIFDHSWYLDVSTALFEDEPGASELERRYTQIADFEGKLAIGGVLILKFFLMITKDEQKRRFGKLEKDKATRWRVTQADWAQNKRFGKVQRAFEDMIGRTDFSFAPWHVVDSMDRGVAIRRIYDVAIEAFAQALELRRARERMIRPVCDFVPYVKPIAPMPIQMLGDVDLSVRLESDDEYKPRLKKAQKRLRELHYKLYEKRVPVVLGFEGWDAAGKGGSILRLTQALDARGYEVNPTSAPNEAEKMHHYLWRFYQNLPKDGHIAIFDRTWYGRVMVERIEGFCAEADWQRAYDEINQFEKSLSDWGAIVIKFWLQIDQQEQLRRFTERQNTPEKQYKITDEDWRNREKWPQYEAAVNEMLQKTNTRFAPWVIVESVDKHYGRLKVLETVIEAIERRLG